MSKCDRTFLIPLLSVLALETAVADNFNYEIGVSFDRIDATLRTEAGVFPIPPIPIAPPTLKTDQELDDITLGGTWYWNGVTANEGPRSRAAFLARASDVSFLYADTSADATLRVISNDPAIPSTTNRSSASGDLFALGFRYVWDASGWYVSADLATADLDLGNATPGTDADAYSVGVGKYIGARTALELIVLYEELSVSGFGSDSDADVAVNFTHIGDMGREWDWGIDVGLSTQGGGSSDVSFDTRFSLYPTRSLAFGLDVAGPLDDFSDGPVDYGAFVSWFLNERFEVAASLGTTDVDTPPRTDIDETNYGIGIRYRF